MKFVLADSVAEQIVSEEFKQQLKLLSKAKSEKIEEMLESLTLDAEVINLKGLKKD